MSALIGLYDPYIHFRDDNWLKLTALYWDKMARIVPKEVTTEDSDTVKQLADELGFIQNFAPCHEETFELGMRFSFLIESNAKKVQQRYRVAETREGTPVTAASIFGETMSHDMQNVLVHHHLAVRQEKGDPGWVRTHPNLAAVYMSALAETMSARRQLHPAAAETLGHLAMSGLTMERLAQVLLEDVELVENKPSQSEVEECMAVVALHAVLPKNLDAIPVKKIVAFRKKYPAPLATFQSYVHGLVAENGPLQEIKDTQTLRLHLEAEYEKTVKPQLDELHRRLRSIFIDVIPGAFNVKAAIPPVVAKGAATLGLAINPVLAAAGRLTLALLPVIRKAQEKSRKAMQLPAAYLMSVEKNLTPQTLTSRIGAAMRRFVLAA